MEWGGKTGVNIFFSVSGGSGTLLVPGGENETAGGWVFVMLDRCFCK